MNTDLIRFVDSISRDKNIDKESVFLDLEAAMLSAARKAYDDPEDVVIKIDRMSGTIEATVNQQPIDMKTLGRIAAQTAKQVMIQRIREDERSAIFEEYSQLVGTIATGTVTRVAGSTVIVNLGRGEAILPRSEQIPGDQHHPGERVRGMILNVREEQNQVTIVLTQTHKDYIRKLFELEVPEVGERIIEIRALAREAGYRTKVAVSSIDTKVDAVGACVGVRGSRIRNIVDELGGEKIDIVRWNESSQVLISNALKPAEVKETLLCFELGRATVIVEEDQLSLAIGKRGQNVRLAAQLVGWDIDILTPAEYNKSIDAMEKALKSIEGVEDVLLEKFLAMGIISLGDMAEIGAEPISNAMELSPEFTATLIETASVEAKRIAAENEAAKAAAKAEKIAADLAAKEAEAAEATQALDPESSSSADESKATDAAESVADVETDVATEALADNTPREGDALDETKVEGEEVSKACVPAAVDEVSTPTSETEPGEASTELEKEV